jgi:hypothetical protein
MEKNRYEIQTIDATGLKEITCPHCGYTNKLPPRTLSLEKLRKMQDTKKIHESIRKEGLIVGGKTLINPRAMVCSNCQKISILKDSFSELLDYGEKKQA